MASFKGIINRVNKLISHQGDVDAHISENVAAFVASIEPERVAKIQRPGTYEGSVEILIPCYNHGSFLADTINSIENQTFLPRHLVITFINDNSTDNSLKKMRELQRQSSLNIKIINNKKNINQAGCLNKAVKASKNELFINLNADDLLVPNCIELIIETYRKNPEIFLLGGSSTWFETGQALPKHKALKANELKLTKYGPVDALSFDNLNSINMSQSSSSFFRCAWELVGGYYDRDRRVCSFDDRDFQMRVCSLLPIGVYKDYPMQFYRTDSSQGRGTA